MFEQLSHDNGERVLILSPNKSMTWEDNKKVLLVMFAVAMLIGGSFAYIGAWMILPFAGLEVLLVGIAMYYACWKLNFKEVITVKADCLLLQKGVYFPKQQWQWPTSQTCLLKRASNYRMSAPSLYLQYLNEVVEIGAFLNREEKLALRQALVRIGLALRKAADE